ncbi:MAG: response regulator [Lachnospiraceae bacterium]|nr:response regulator [Lachnospiraceae bacterium]
MFGKNFVLNEQSLSIIGQIGENMPGGFFICKAYDDQEILYANMATCRIFGCDSLDDFKSLTGFTFQGLIHPDDHDAVEASIQEQLTSNNYDMGYVEFRIVRKDGEVCWIDSFGHYIKSDAYKGLYYVLISDITDKHREHQEAETDKVNRTAVIEALTASYDSVWLVEDVDEEKFSLFRIDKTMAHLLPANEAVKINKFSQALVFYSQLVLEDDRQKFLEAVSKEKIKKYTTDKLLYSVPFRRVFKEGIRYYRLEFAKTTLPDGRMGIVAGFKDVDDEVRKEQRIQHSLSLRSAVIEALTASYDSVWLINDIVTEEFELYRIDQTMVHMMPANAAMKLKKFSEAFEFYSKLVLEEDREQFLKAVKTENIVKNTEYKRIYSIPFRRVFADGIRYYRLEFAKLQLSDGKTGIVGGFKDVDDEVRKEQQIQQALREAIDAANASNKAKSDFLSSMSHDIRTPMNGIIGMTTIAANNLDDRERVADCLRKIKGSSDHLLSLINEVLDMNKIESGKVELVEEEFNLAELIDQMLVMTRPLLQSHGHSFRVNIVNVEHEQVVGDSRRIQQVFVNIMSNAIKYTPNGGKISLSVMESPTKVPDFGHYQFVFEDNGYGMTEEFLTHLFEPFTRANDKQTAGIQGTGLGMAITRNIVRMMGGDISVESVYGKGSKFTVNIYLKFQNEGRINYEAFTDLRILVADDDPVCCESTCEILNDMGMNSEWVLSGKAAVDRMKVRMEQGRDFFAVIIDWKLPDQNGIQTTRQIRQLVGNDVPIVIFSAYDWTDIEQEARAAGANAFISKPLFRTKLAKLFHGLVNKKSDDEANAPLRTLEELKLNGRKILLAEDQEINAEIATDFLEMTGLEVDWACDGEQAVEKFAASPDGFYSMIFMDIQMPNMNGLDATRKIRSMDREYAKRIPIVAMTANAFTDDVINCKMAGMNEHITKPIDIDVLAKVLNAYIGKD